MVPTEGTGGVPKGTLSVTQAILESKDMVIFGTRQRVHDLICVHCVDATPSLHARGVVFLPSFLSCMRPVCCSDVTASSPYTCSTRLSTPDQHKALQLLIFDITLRARAVQEMHMQTRLPHQHLHSVSLLPAVSGNVPLNETSVGREYMSTQATLKVPIFIPHTNPNETWGWGHDSPLCATWPCYDAATKTKW